MKPRLNQTLPLKLTETVRQQQLGQSVNANGTIKQTLGASTNYSK